MPLARFTAWIRRLLGLPPAFPEFTGWTMEVIPNRHLRLGEHVLQPGYIYTVPAPNASYWARKGLARLNGNELVTIDLMGHNPEPAQPAAQVRTW